MRRVLRILLLLPLPLMISCKSETPPPQKDVVMLTPAPVPAFNADRAYADVARQVSFGPRVPNTPAHDSALAFYQRELRKTTESVELQPFTFPAYSGDPLQLTNVVASFNPSAKHRLLLLAHWDSRPWADEEMDPVKRKLPVLGANDGASGAAVLLELARIFKENPPPIGVDLLFDDGEDYGKPEEDQLNRYFLGVKYFVQAKQGYTPFVAILLDMVGDSNAEFRKEVFSMRSAPDYVNLIWNTAAELGLSKFHSEMGPNIEDDHVPLIQAGYKAIDLIDANLVGANVTDSSRAYWHTTRDVMNRISAETLGQVGKLLVTMIYDRFPRVLPAE